MAIYVISGTANIDTNTLIEKFREFTSQEKFKDKGGVMFEFPEYSEKQHPQNLFNDIKKLTKDCIKCKCNLFILTYNDHVFNAVRCSIKETSYEEGNCVAYINTENQPITSKILKNGTLEYWENGIFDMWEKALMELI